MTKFMDKIYDEMELMEVICRLPGELAIKAIKRRIPGADNLAEFFDAAAVENETSKCGAVKNHVNSIVGKYDDICHVLDVIGEKYHSVLHGYLNDMNKTRLVVEGADRLSVKFLFNLTDHDDADGMKKVLDKALAEQDTVPSQILSILNKSAPENCQTLINIVLKDKRPLIQSTVLSVGNEYNFKTISEHQKMIALKAFAKIPSSQEGIKGIQPLDFKLFQDLKPLERLLALDRYLSYFPVYKKRKAFNPEPSVEDFDAILFAGCFQYYDLVEGIKEKYDAITKDDGVKI